MWSRSAVLASVLGILWLSGCDGGGSLSDCQSAAIGPMKCGGGPTAPAGVVVSSDATKAPGAGLTDHPKVAKSSTSACNATNVGKCGCLAPADWYSDGNFIYDVVCCDAVGSAYTLYACTDAYNCDDSGASIVCTLNGAPGH